MKQTRGFGTTFRWHPLISAYFTPNVFVDSPVLFIIGFIVLLIWPFHFLSPASCLCFMSGIFSLHFTLGFIVNEVSVDLLVKLKVE